MSKRSPQISPHDRQRSDTASRRINNRADKPARTEQTIVRENSRKIPRFTHDEMMGVAARALAKSFRKPKRKYASH